MHGLFNPKSPNPRSLNPTLSERLSAVLRPDFAHTVLARRIAAGLLVVLAAASALRPDPAGTYVDVAVAATDLRPGTALRVEDAELQKRSVATLPDGALTNLTHLWARHSPGRRGAVRSSPTPACWGRGWRG